MFRGALIECLCVCVCVCMFYVLCVCAFICVFIYLSEGLCACRRNIHVCVGGVCSQITMPLATIIHQRRSAKRRWHRSLTKNFLTILAQNSKIQISSDWNIRKQYHTDKQMGQSIILWLLSFLSISLCLFKDKGWTELNNNAWPAASVLWTFCLTRTAHFCLICDQWCKEKEKWKPPKSD